MSLLKEFYYNTCSLLPMQFLKAMAPATTLLPYHHIVSSEQLPHIQHLYNYKSENQFIKDLDFLLKHYKPLSVSEIIQAIIEDKKLPIQSFLLSFDDGFREVHDIIAPILEKKGLPAIFFINPAFIDNKELFYRCKISLLIDKLQKNKTNNSILKIYCDALHLEGKSIQNIVQALKKINQNNISILDNLAHQLNFSFDFFLQKEQPFLSSGQIQSLFKRGFSIGAHSMTHPYYHLLTLTDQVNQTIYSCNYVNDLVGSKNCSFSFPHSDIKLNQELFNELKKTDIPLFFGIQNQKEELKNRMLHRFNAERPGIKINSQIKGLLLMMWLKNIFHNNNVIRK